MVRTRLRSISKPPRRPRKKCGHRSRKSAAGSRRRVKWCVAQPPILGTNSDIAGLARIAQRIGDVVKLIQDIAEQTNLLALNATIEATPRRCRARLCGRRLGSEVARGADGEGRQEITREISSVQGATSEAVSAIRAITERMQDISMHTSEVVGAIEQQEMATGEISTTSPALPRAARPWLLPWARSPAGSRKRAVRHRPCWPPPWRWGRHGYALRRGRTLPWWSRSASGGVTLHTARVGGGTALRPSREAAVSRPSDHSDPTSMMCPRRRSSAVVSLAIRPSTTRTRDAPCAARMTTGNARNARPACRSLPASSCRHAHGAGNWVIHWSC